MKQVIIRASQSDFGQVDFYSYLPEGQVKENGGCSTPVNNDQDTNNYYCHKSM